MPLDTTVKRDGGDGQVTLGEQVIMKQTARRRLYEGKVLAGFAGSVDAFTLFEKFETKLQQFSGNLERRC